MTLGAAERTGYGLSSMDAFDYSIGSAVLPDPTVVGPRRARPFRHHGHYVDFTTQVWAAAQDTGLEPVQRLVAPLCGIKDDRLVTRGRCDRPDP